MNLFRASALLVCALSLAACEQNAVQDLTGPLPSARVKFYNFAVGGPGVNFYANDTKMTAISSATGVEATTGVNFGGVAAGDRYVGIDPGQYNFSGRIAAAVDKDLPIATLPGTIADGRFYSFFLSGIYNTATKTADAFLVEDVLPANIDWTMSYLRFVHAISNAGPMTLFARNTETGVETAIGGATAYKAGGAFVALPRGTYDVSMRAAGSTANVVVRTGVGLEVGRIYTIAARGNATVTTGATAPTLDLTTNRQR